MFKGQENELSLDKLCLFDSFIHEIFMHQLYNKLCAIFWKYNKEQENMLLVFETLRVYGRETNIKQISIHISI